MKWKIFEIDPMLKRFEGDINLRMDNYERLKKKLAGSGKISEFANAHNFYGLHKLENGWIYREWCPNADALALVGDFNNWDGTANPMTKIDNGGWEVFIPGKGSIKHKSYYKVRVTAKGNTIDRVPLFAERVIWDNRLNPNAQVWEPSKPFKWTDDDFKPSVPKLIYECHIGMSSEEPKISGFTEFCENVLPRVKSGGYNAIQIMALMEHPYYASFGYQVTNFYALSSRFGTPDEFRALVNAAHEMGISVYLDLVHSHASLNVVDGINEFDGTDYQFFHAGAKGNHPAWGTKLFDYSKPDVLNFLLSNLKYWIETYHLDGFRFDGVTSMLYHHHGLGVDFMSLDKYFSMMTDTDAVAYLQLANELVHEVNPRAVTVAEDMSGMPGMALPTKFGGIGFDFRLSMGVPDYWIRTLRTCRDEDWDLGKLWYELTTRRPGESNIGYSESHDQALVGDKTVMFWLADKEMYWHMSENDQNMVIDRAIALHKMIRLISMSLAGEGYMNFMGNEFGHPEWIDFPRAGNGDSYHYARRRWSLADNKELKYKFLMEFDKAMIKTARSGKLLGKETSLIQHHQDHKILSYRKGEFTFFFNFHHEHVERVSCDATPGKIYKVVLDSDDLKFGGFGRHAAAPDYGDGKLWFDLHPRTAVVMR